MITSFFTQLELLKALLTEYGVEGCNFIWFEGSEFRFVWRIDKGFVMDLVGMRGPIRDIAAVLSSSGSALVWKTFSYESEWKVVTDIGPYVSYIDPISTEKIPHLLGFSDPENYLAMEHALKAFGSSLYPEAASDH